MERIRLLLASMALLLVSAGVVSAQNLTIDKSHAGNFVRGQSGTYTIQVRSVLFSPASDGEITVTDTLPTGLTYSSAAGSGWDCVSAGQTVSCVTSQVIGGGILPDNATPITLTVNVLPNAPLPSVTNTATLSGGGDMTPGNNVANDPTNISVGSDLRIAKSHAGNFTQGQTGAQYTIAVSNAGTGDSSGTVTVTDTLPASLTAAALAGTGWNCTLATLSCTRSDALAPSNSYPPITLTVNVSASAPASVTNIATVSGGGDSSAGNNTANDPTNIGAGVDLTINKSHSGNFTKGQNGTYSIVVTNSGGGNSSGTITVSDVLPSGLTPTNASGPAWDCNIASQTVTCTRNATLNGGSAAPPITLTVSVAASAPLSVTNTATVSGGGEPAGANGNNSGPDPTTIINPLPSTSGITPNPATAGSGGFTLTVNGNNFVGGGGPSVVQWNGIGIPTTFVSSTVLTATVDSARVQAPGTATVTVFNPTTGGGGGTSNGQIITINNPVPGVLSLNPSAVLAGGPDFTLAVNGSGFVSNSVVRWNGENLATTFVSGGQLTASVSASRIALAGSASVSVSTPGPGGGTSNAVSFTINNPTDLSITNVVPGTAIAGSGTLQVTVLGSNFVAGSAVRWNAQAVPATFISPTEMTATINAVLLTTAGTAEVTVFNPPPPPGGGTSNVFTFTINNPLPVLNSINPSGKSAGQEAFTMTLTGSGFVAASQAHWNGTALTTTFVSAAELRAAVPAHLIANAGTATVTVSNPGPGGGTSSPRQFTIGDQLTITTETPLPDGGISQPYSETIQAVGGNPPYRWALAVGSQVPPGLNLNPNSGILSGTPTQAGTFSVNIQVSDALNVMASKAFVLTINSAEFLITTASPLPNAQLGVAYTQTFAAAGGTAPYGNWRVTGGQLPGGLTLNANSGTLSGTPNAAGVFNFSISVSDSAGGTASKDFTLTTPPPGNALTILTTSCPAAFVGAAYECPFTASGGVPNYTWAITAGTLPAGLALNTTTGVISGTPQSVGEANLTIRVTDAVTATDTQTFTINVTAATVTISLLGTEGPAQQNQVTLTLPQARSTAVTGQVALSFTPDPAFPNGGAGLDDPAIQFSNGGRTAAFSVPAGSTEATFTGGNLMLQTGTIAGTVTVTLTSMQAGGSVITPSPAPSQTVVVGRLAPVISSVRIVNRTAAGFSIEVTGYSTPRELTQASFQFAGQNLQGAQATVQLGTVAQTWYASQPSLAFGSLFTYTQPFTTSADPAGITSVSVTLTNSLGNSAGVSANF